MLEGRAIFQGEIWAGWKSGWARTSQSLTGMCSKSCSRDGIIKDVRAAWGLCAWKGSGFLVDSKVTRCQCKENQTWAASTGALDPVCVWQRVWGRSEHTSSGHAWRNTNYWEQQLVGARCQHLLCETSIVSIQCVKKQFLTWVGR